MDTNITNRDFKGVWIPREIWFNSDLKIIERILLVEIDSLDNENGCFASNAYFANFFEVTEPRIAQMISKLKKLGYIYQESFNGRMRVLRSNLSFKNKENNNAAFNINNSDFNKFKHNNIDNNKDNNSFSFSLNKFKEKENIEISSEEEISDIPNKLKNPSSIESLKPSIKNKPSIYDKQNKPSIKEMSDSLKNNIKQKISKLNKPTASPHKNAPEPIMDIIELWEQLGFKKINPDRAPKTFNKTVEALKKIQKGKLIPGETRKFTIDNIKDAIVKYSLIAFDSEYGPDNPEIKKALANKSLEAFLYCPGFGDKKKNVLSWMVKCYDDPPLTKKTDIENIEEKYPMITKKFKHFYSSHVLCGWKKKYNQSDEMKFRKAANRVGDAYHKLSSLLLGVRDPDHLADLFCQSVAKSYGNNITKIYPGSMGSDFAISRLLAFLQEREMIENKAKERFYPVF